MSQLNNQLIFGNGVVVKNGMINQNQNVLLFGLARQPITINSVILLAAFKSKIGIEIIAAFSILQMDDVLFTRKKN